jgi:hypothetical protein
MSIPISGSLVTAATVAVFERRNLVRGVGDDVAHDS